MIATLNTPDNSATLITRDYELQCKSLTILAEARGREGDKTVEQDIMGAVTCISELAAERDEAREARDCLARMGNSIQAECDALRAQVESKDAALRDVQRVLSTYHGQSIDGEPWLRHSVNMDVGRLIGHVQNALSTPPASVPDAIEQFISSQRSLTPDERAAADGAFLAELNAAPIKSYPANKRGNKNTPLDVFG